MVAAIDLKHITKKKQKKNYDTFYHRNLKSLASLLRFVTKSNSKKRMEKGLRTFHLSLIILENTRHCINPRY